ncbi:uncharacterized protein PAC_08787 [Phialocephala subalpina]|uniref:Uncharacterized protein n=1 Tax=Phialocephala subalpina TaxID=576137 RepID=A0A1L7X1I4_9HELO|nr:uncharacterized protein PAC_08787 [Phialocephala subalpina]
MPALPSTSLVNAFIDRTASSTIPNATSSGLQVVCAWPVSGQYGPGSRVLYYALIAACIFARKAAWLRSACLAAALLFPAVAALHGIVLAAIHVDVRTQGAADMDVYGAFQLCSIGILAAPVTVRLSRTYFFDPGRNIIYLWTLLLLAGILSLTVEFFRINPVNCTHDDDGNPIPSDASKFPYGAARCGLVCSIDQGPHSPMRRGAANNIYVIPTPERLTFDTATLMAAACCIPAILSLIFMWNKILEINWKTRRKNEEQMNEPITGTNGATMKQMKGVNGMVRLFLSAVEIPVFGAAVLAILVIGERNFWSHQVVYQTEPITSIGQWAPIVGTALAVLGSIYLLVAVDRKSPEDEDKPSEDKRSASVDHISDTGTEHRVGRSTVPIHSSSTNIRHSFQNHIRRISSEKEPVTNVGYRHKVAKALTTVVTYFGTAADDRFDDSGFKRGRADDFPEIPGEEHRNSALPQIREQYNKLRDADGNVTPMVRGARSRAGSFTSSTGSGVGAEGDSPTLRAPSPQSPQSRHSSGQLLSPNTPTRPQASTPTPEKISFELHPLSTSTSAVLDMGMRRQGSNTLQVPSPVRHNSTRE